MQNPTMHQYLEHFPNLSFITKLWDSSQEYMSPFVYSSPRGEHTLSLSSVPVWTRNYMVILILETFPNYPRT